MKTIEELALESGLIDTPEYAAWSVNYMRHEGPIKEFAKLLKRQFLTRMVDDMERSLAANDARVAAAVAAEREACAKACEDLEWARFDDYESAPFAAVIRARSTAATDIPPRIATP